MSDAPRRIQRKRTKGWRMPEGAVYVGRPTRWGNRFHTRSRFLCAVVEFPPAVAVKMYREMIERDPAMIKQIRAELRGKTLVCWCPLDCPCHADVLLEISNAD